MKTFFSILVVGLSAIAVHAQERAKEKPAAQQQAANGSDAEGEAPKAAKETDKKMEGFDVNFRHQVERTRSSIYTLGGRLVPAGKKTDEGC